MEQLVCTGNMSSTYKIADGIYVREGNLPIRDQCNSGFIVLKNSTAVIDLSNQDPDEEIFEEAERVTGLPVKYLLLTHAHGDHMIGMKTLHRKDFTLIARDTALTELRQNNIPLPDAIIEIPEERCLKLDGREMLVSVPGHHGHSPWDLLITVKDAGVMFAGDLIAKRSDMYFHSADTEGWIACMEELIERLGDESQVQTIVQGHGGRIPVTELPEVKQYLEDLNLAAHMLLESKTQEASYTALYKSLLKRSTQKDVVRQMETILHWRV